MQPLFICLLMVGAAMSTSARPMKPVNSSANDTAKQVTVASSPSDHIDYEGVDWVCGPPDQDVKGTTIQVIEAASLQECRGLCPVLNSAPCEFVTYSSDSKGTIGRCTLKMNWNKGPDGTTGYSAGTTWCCIRWDDGSCSFQH